MPRLKLSNLLLSRKTHGRFGELVGVWRGECFLTSSNNNRITVRGQLDRLEPEALSYGAI